jgi:hypothetical protein
MMMPSSLQSTLAVENFCELFKNTSTYYVTCNSKSLKRKIMKYNKNSELPWLSNFDIGWEGNHLYPINISIHQLVDRLSSSAGRAQTPPDFNTNVMDVNLSLRLDAGLPTSLQPPSLSGTTWMGTEDLFVGTLKHICDNRSPHFLRG